MKKFKQVMSQHFYIVDEDISHRLMVKNKAKI